MDRICYQVNLQPTIGGGEIYARFFTRALSRLGWRTVILVARDAPFWPGFMSGVKEGVEFRAVFDDASLQAALPAEPGLIVTHTVLSAEVSPVIAARHRLTGIAHMPLYDRKPRGLVAYRKVFAVSEHVRASAIACGLGNVHPEPLLGVADLAPRAATAPIRSESPYDWDKRKFRDRLLGWMQSRAPLMFGRHDFVRQHGLTLGIVSRLTPIKQFPAMFEILAPVLARFPNVRLEIFGSGGYASVRDLKRALAPAGQQARFWGQQTDVAGIYPQLDYVLSGLPEKEALGLNLIEAQVSGTPVLAVRAAPFTETVLDGASGHLFEDPRKDGGAGFEALLKRLTGEKQHLDPSQAVAHLEKFSMDAFCARVGRALDAVV